MSTRPHLFISYPHLEKDFTARLAADLQNHGLHLWMDILESGIQHGDNWRLAIEQGLDTAAGTGSGYRRRPDRHPLPGIHRLGLLPP